uniref:Phorbol ester/diacylglycerol-binding protein unc-13 n=1 Tax=Cacopsylla melanoneura TaxID=428564 RepID=A0A8D9AMT0_9HEMI
MSLLNVTVKKAHFEGPQSSQYNSYVTLKLQNVKSTTVTVKGPSPCWEQDFLFETNDVNQLVLFHQYISLLLSLIHLILFETNDVNQGLLIEVWDKGIIWDRAIGYHYLPLPQVPFSHEDGPGQWLSLDGELVMMDGEVVGTKIPTGHSILMDCRFELPFGSLGSGEENKVGSPNSSTNSDYEALLSDRLKLDPNVLALKRKSVCPPGSVCPPDPENTEGPDLQRKLELLNNIMDQEARNEQARRQYQYYGHCK